MKVNIEIADDSKLFEVIAAEISRSNNDREAQATSDKEDLSFELTRSEISQLTCIAVSCGVSAQI